MELSDIFKTLLYPKGNLVAEGQFQSTHGTSLIAKCYLPLIGIPKSQAKSEFSLTIEPQRTELKWTRLFKKRPFTTHVSNDGDDVIERSGPAQFRFKIEETASGILHYHFQKLRLFGISVPKFLSIRASAICKRVSAKEWHFEVTTVSPNGKLIVKYWGNGKLKR